MSHPLSRCRYGLGKKVHMLGLSTPGEIVSRSIVQDANGVHIMYVVEYRTWPNDPPRFETMSEEKIQELETSWQNQLRRAVA